MLARSYCCCSESRSCSNRRRWRSVKPPLVTAGLEVAGVVVPEAVEEEGLDFAISSTTLRIP
ncbi:MAG: hypothetical protein RM347_021970 [Nostoc sp. ChiQUE02]|nr:hypothetical protein [Nostoc sp. ChiQUE02]